MKDLTYAETKFMDYIEQIIKSNKLNHSYLVEVDNYDNDLIFIYNFVKKILCPLKSGVYSQSGCKTCNICKLIDENNYPDLELVEANGSWIKKGQLLELKEEYQNKSLLNNKRIYIIKEAEKLNPSSANTILKFLEEPEEDIIAILLTNNRYNILDTILSRCQILSLKNNSIFVGVEDKLVDFIHFLVSGEDLFLNYKIIIDTVLQDKEQAKLVFTNIENLFVSYLNYKANLISDFSISKFPFLEQCNIHDILIYITIIEEELPKLMYNINYKLWLDTIFSRFVEVK